MAGRRDVRTLRRSSHEHRALPDLGLGSRRDHRDHPNHDRVHQHRHQRRGRRHRPDLDPGNHRDHDSAHLLHPDRQGHGPGSRRDLERGHPCQPDEPGAEGAWFRDSDGARPARSALLAAPCRCCRQTGCCPAAGRGCGPCRCCHRTDCCRAGVRWVAEYPATGGGHRRWRREWELPPRARMHPQPGSQQTVPVPREPGALRAPAPRGSVPLAQRSTGPETTGPETTGLRTKVSEMMESARSERRSPALLGWGRLSLRRPRRLQRAPSKSSWLRPSSPEPRRRAWPRAACGRPVPPPSTTQTLRTHRVLEALQGHPCWTHRALSRAHGPEPWTRLSCLWPGLATRALSANDA
jgi:hypothetical protein